MVSKMKDPDSWNFISSPEVRAAIMAIVIAFLRIAYDNKETAWQRIALEAILCGALSYGISSGLSYFDSIPSGVSVFAGAAVGFLGVDFCRSFARRYFNGKIDGNGDKDSEV